LKIFAENRRRLSAESIKYRDISGPTISLNVNPKNIRLKDCKKFTIDKKTNAFFKFLPSKIKYIDKRHNELKKIRNKVSKLKLDINNSATFIAKQIK